jgi:hypothetical protein
MKNRFVKLLPIVLLSLFIASCGSGGTESIPEVISPDGEGNLPDGRVPEYNIREPNQIDSVNARNGSVRSPSAFQPYQFQFDLQDGYGNSSVIYPSSEDEPNVEGEFLKLVSTSIDPVSQLPFRNVSQLEVQNLKESLGGFYIGATGEEYVLKESHVNFMPCPTSEEVSCSKPLEDGQIEIPNGGANITGIWILRTIKRTDGLDKIDDIEGFYLDFLNPNFAPKPEIF